MQQKNKDLEHTVKTQTSQIHQLYAQIIKLQEKEAEHRKHLEAFDKLDRYVKRMTEKNNQVKIFW